MNPDNGELANQNTNPITSPSQEPLTINVNGKEVVINPNQVATGIVENGVSKSKMADVSWSTGSKSNDQIQSELKGYEAKFERENKIAEADGVLETAGKFTESFLTSMAAGMWDIASAFDVGDWRLPEMYGAGTAMNSVFKAVDNTIGDGEKEVGNWFSRRAALIREESAINDKMNTGNSYVDYGLGMVANVGGSIAGMGGALKMLGMGMHALRAGKTLNTITGTVAATYGTAFSIAEGVKDEVYQRTLHDLAPDLKSLEQNTHGETYNKALDEGKSAEEAEYLARQAVKTVRDEYAKSNPLLHEAAMSSAMKGADAAIKFSTIGFLLNMGQATQFIKGHYASRKVLESASTFSTKEILKEAGQEAIEEGIVEGIAEDYGVNYGMKGEYGVNDALKKIWSLETLESMVIGGLAGGGMAALAQYSNKNIKGEDGLTHAERYQKQQGYIKKWNEIGATVGQPDMIDQLTTLNKNSLELTEIVKEQKKLVAQGKEEEAKALGSKILSVQASQAFASGTTASLIENYEKIARDSSFKPEVRQRAQEALVQIKDMEKVYNKSLSYSNGSDIYSNRVNDYSLSKAEQELKNKIIEKKLEANTAIESSLRSGETSLKVKDTLKVVDEYNQRVVDEEVDRDLSYNLDTLFENPYTNQTEADAYSSFKDYASKNIQAVRELLDLQGQLKTIQQHKDENNKTYNKITSKQFQRSLKFQDSLTRDIRSNKETMDSFKGTDKFMPYLDNILKKYKGKIDDSTLEYIKDRYELENEVTKEASKKAQTEAVSKALGKKGEENKQVAPTTKTDDKQTVETIATKVNSGIELSKDEKEFYTQFPTQIDDRLKQLKTSTEGEGSQSGTMQTNEDLEVDGQDTLNPERQLVATKLNNITSIVEDSLFEEEAETVETLSPALTSKVDKIKSDPSFIQDGVYKTSALKRFLGKDFDTVMDSLMKTGTVEFDGTNYVVAGKQTAKVTPNNNDIQIAKIESRRLEELNATKKIGEDNLKEGRKLTKKIVESLKQRYPVTSAKGIIIRILEKLIDFNKYSTIVDSKYINGQGASGQATWFGMMISQETLDGILEGKEHEVHTFIHEFIHGFTTSKISDYNIEKLGLIPGFKSKLTSKEKNAIEQLQRIFEKVKRDNPNLKEYGFTNLDEFIAEAFSNESFQYTLKNTKSEGKKSNLFVEFINAIGDILFEQLERWAKRQNKEIPNRETITGILEDVLAWTEELIDQNNKLAYIGTAEEINAKYDAEIKALGNTNQSTKPTTKPNTGLSGLAISIINSPSFQETLEDRYELRVNLDDDAFSDADGNLNSAGQAQEAGFNEIKEAIDKGEITGIKAIRRGNSSIITYVKTNVPVSYDPDEISYEPDEIKKDLSAEVKEQVREQVESYVISLEGDLGRTPTFEEFIKDYIKNGGRTNTDKLFNVLIKGWELNNYPKSDYSSIYNKLFKDRKQMANSLLELAEQVITPQTKEEISEQIKEEAKTPTQEKKVIAISPEGKVRYEHLTMTSEDTRPKLGYSSRKAAPVFYTEQDGDMQVIQTDFEYTEEGLSESDLVKSLKLLNPDKYLPGEELEVVIPTGATLMNMTIPVYNDEGIRAGETTFGEWLKGKLLENPDFESTQEYEDRVPMLVKDNEGDYVAYVHEPEWYHPLKFRGDVREAQHNARVIRKMAMKANKEGNSAKLKITSNQGGMFQPMIIPNTQPWVKLKDANPQAKSGIVKNNEILIDGKPFKGILVNEKDFLTNTNNKPVDVRRWGTDENGNPTYRAFQSTMQPIENEQVETVYQAVLTYLFNKSYSKEPIALEYKKVKDIVQNTLGANFNLGDYTNLDNFLKLFIMVSNKKMDSNLTEAQIAGVMKADPYVGKGLPYIFTYQGGNVVFGVGGEATAYKIAPSDLKNGISGQVQSKLDELKRILPMFNQNIGMIGGATYNGKVLHIDNKGNVNTVSPTYSKYIGDKYYTNVMSHNIGTDDKPNYVTRIQPSIYFEPTGELSRKKEAVIASKEEVTETKKQQVTNTVEVLENVELEEVVTKLEEKDWKFAGDTLEEKVEDLKELLSTQNQEAVEIVETIKQDDDYHRTIKKAYNQVKWVDEYFDNSDDLSYEPVEIQTEEVKEMTKDLFKIPGLSPNHQSQLVDFVFNSASQEFSFDYEEAVDKDKLKSGVTKKLFASLDANLQNLNSTLEELRKLESNNVVDSLIKKYETAIDKINLVKDNSDIIAEEGLNKLFKYANIKVTEIKNEEGDVVQVVEEGTDSNTDNEKETNEDENSALSFDEVSTEREDNYSQTSLEKNPKNSVTKELRLFMSAVEDINPKTQLPNTGVMGVPLYVGFDSVYDTVQSFLADSPSDFNTMVGILELHKDSHAWMPTLIERLKNADNQVKKQFVLTMGTHALKMEFLMYSFNTKDGTYSLKVMDTNSSAITKKIEQMWKNNLLSSSIVTMEDGQYVTNVEVAKELYNQYNSWVESPEKLKSKYNSLLPLFKGKVKKGETTTITFSEHSAIDKKYVATGILKDIEGGRLITINQEEYVISKSGDNQITIKPFERSVVGKAISKYQSLTPEEQASAIEEVQVWFNNFGIELADNAIDHIFRNGLYTNNGALSVSQFFEESSATSSPMGILASWLNGVVSGNIGTDIFDENNEKNNPLRDYSIEKTLTKHQSKYTKAIVTNSFRDGKKSIFGFTATKFITDRFQDLKTNEELRGQLGSLSFSKHSMWLEFMGTELLNKFNLSHLGLTAIAEFGKKNYKDNSITSLSDADHELIKIGMFQDVKQGATSKTYGSMNIGLRVAKFLFPTMSDKTTMTVVQTPVIDLTETRLYLDNAETLQEPVLNIVFQQTVLPEIERIINFKNNVKKTNIKSYDDGAKMLSFMPFLNDLEIKLNEQVTVSLRDLLLMEETTVEDILSQKVRNQIMGEIQNYLNKLMNDKVEVWKNNGYIVEEEGVKKIKFMDGKYLSKIETDNFDEKMKIAAYDFVVNNVISNANAFMTIIGDPALYYKSNTSKDFIAQSEETFINVGKRLAAMIAPGSKIADSQNEQYLQVFLKDKVSLSENIDFLCKLLDGKAFDTNEYNRVMSLPEKGESELQSKKLQVEKKRQIDAFYNQYPNSNGYFDIEGTDAQEYTTWQEHLHILEQMGRVSDNAASITPDEIREAKEMFASGISIDNMSSAQKEVLKKVLQPIKPVYTGQIYDADQDVMRMMYIKSSSFPLIPQLTEGLEINKLRVGLEKMQETTGKKVRASYQTANKVGALTTPLSLFNADGSIKEITEDNLKASTLTLNRKDFKIQLDVPFKSLKRNEDTVTLGTQLTKLLFGNGIMDEVGFMLDGKPLSGKALEKEYTDTFIQLANLKKKKLYNELGIDELTGEPIDLQKTAIKLQKLLKDEAISKGYSKQDIEALELEPVYSGGKLIDIKFKMPLWVSANANRFESLLNAIVTNRLVKMKFPGNSYVVGSEEGFRFQDNLEGVDKNKIVWTNKWTGKLQAAKYDAKGNLMYTQVLAPSKFRDAKGKLIDLLAKDKDGTYKYVTQTGKGFIIKNDKFSEELLSITSFRIPTSGHVSASQIEIVGFLPQEVGDLMIVPRNLTKQKGLDFDIDKENTYQLWHIETENGFRPLQEGDDVPNIKEKLLQNKLVNIHKSVLSNPSTNVQKKINGILSIKFAQDQSEMINEWVEGNKDKKYFTPLSDEYQKSKMFLGASGKVGTGAYSLDVTSHSLFEQAKAKGTPLRLIDENTFIMSFGDKYKSTGELGESKTIDGDRKIAEVLAERQNIAVDNEKEQVMGKVNLNGLTLDVDKVLCMLGFDKGEDGNSIPFLFLSQPILKDYVAEMSNASANIAEFSKDKESKVIQKLLEKYGVEDFEMGLETDKEFGEMMTNIKMASEIQNKPDGMFQAAILNRFLLLKKYGAEIRGVQSTINIDSAGLGKSVAENAEKMNTVSRLFSNTTIENAGALLGQSVSEEDITASERQELISKGYVPFMGLLVKPTTINGIFTINALTTADKLWTKHFPYQTSVMNTLFSEIMPLISNSESSDAKKAEKRQIVMKEVKKYLNTVMASKTIFENTSAQEERKRLFIDNDATNHQSLATYLRDAIKLPVLNNNKLLQRFEFEVNKDGKPSIIKYNNAAGASFDEDYLNNALLELMERNVPISSFNGEIYTTRKLAQDLITYSLLEGGVQEAIQFAKFIPLRYLDKLGFTTAMSSVDFNTANRTFGINLSDKKEPWDVSTFTIQFAQNNPRTLPKLENITNKKPEELVKMDTFNLSAISDAPGANFFSLRHDGKFHLWQRVANDTYIKIPVVGTHGMSEYNNERGAVETVIKPLVEKDKSKKGNEPKGETKFIKQQLFGIEVEPTMTVLNNIIKDSSTPNDVKVIMEKLLGDFDQTVKIVVKEIKGRGAYDSNTNTIFIHPEYLATASKEELSRTVLKEMVHSITDKELLKYADRDGNLIIEDAPKHIVALTQLFKRTKEILGEDRINEVKEKFKRDKGLEPIEKRVIYGGTNLLEFVEMIMTQPEFQQEMAKHKMANGKSLLDKFIEFVSNLLTVLNVPSDSITSEALNNIFNMIQKPVESKVESTSNFKFAQFSEFETTAEFTGEQYADDMASPGDVVIYKNQEYLVLGLSDNGGLRLMDFDGNKFSGTPQPDKIDKLVAMFDTIKFENTDYIVLDKDNIVSTATGKKVFTSNDNSTVTRKRKLLELFNEEVGFYPSVETQESKTSNAFKSFTKDLFLELDAKINEDYGSVRVTTPNIAKFQQYPLIQKYFNAGYDVSVDEYNFIQQNTEEFNTLLQELGVSDVVELTDKLKDMKVESSTPTVEIKQETNVEEKLIEKVESLEGMKKYELFPGVFANKEQTEAIDKLDEFVKSPKSGSFVLIGRGGTGKTTIVKKVLEMNPNARIVGGTMGHNAKQILQESLGNKAKAYTTASLTGKREDFQNPGKYIQDKNFDPNKSPLKYADVFILDETSMIDETMMKELYDIAGVNTKFIFMGDNVQLPPIREKGSKFEGQDSPTFKEGKGNNFAKLTQRMRQGEDSPIVGLSDIIATNVESENVERRVIKNRKTNFNPSTNKGVIFTTEKDMLSELEKDIKSDVYNTKAVVFTNAKRDQVTKTIRQMLWGKAAENEYNVGEVIMSVDNKKIGGLNPAEIFNGEFYIVTNVVTKNNALRIETFNNGRIESENIAGYVLTVQKKDGTKMNITVPSTSEKERIAKLQNTLANAAKSGLAPWQYFWNNKEAIIAVEYGYAITSHKSQGSTFNNTYVFEDDILGVTAASNKTVNQSLYVALTRPRNKAVIISRENENNDIPEITGDEEILLSLEPNEVTLALKEKINKLFKENPSLSKIGSVEQYSNYLNTIFPNSKVKDILYHGTPDGRFESFDISFAGKATVNVTKGIYLTDSKKTADFYAEGHIDFSEFESREEYEEVKTAKTFSMIINAENLKFVNDPQAQQKQGNAILRTEEKLSDIGYVSNIPDLAHQYIVFDPEQIHILGENKDIEQFKNYVNSQLSYEPNEIVSPTVESKAGFRNTDGSRKRYLKEEMAFNKAKEYNKKNTEYKASVIKVMGEKGDSRVYYAVSLQVRPLASATEKLPSQQFIENNIRKTLKQAYFKNSDVKNAYEITEEIANSKHPLNKLAEKLLPYVKLNNVKISIVQGEYKFTKPNGVQTTAAGLYLPNTNEIQLFGENVYTSSQIEKLILHEILHALTFNHLRLDKSTVNDFNKLYEYTKQTMPNTSNVYAMNTVDEFIVGLFTDSAFIKELEKLPSMSGLKKYDNLLQEVFDYILSLLKITPKSNLYQQAYSVATNVLNEFKMINESMQEIYPEEYYESMEDYEPQYEESKNLTTFDNEIDELIRQGIIKSTCN